MNSFLYRFNNPKFKAGITITLLIGLSLIVNTASAQTTFPLACRGSTDSSLMNFDIAINATGGDSVLVNFTKGTFGAAFAAPFPGTCTWFDRGINANEPARLLHTPGIHFNVGLFIGVPGAGAWTMGSNTHAFIPYVPIGLDFGMVNNPASNPRPGTLFDPNTFYTFNVFNDGKGDLVIKSIRCQGICP